MVQLRFLALLNIVAMALALPAQVSKRDANVTCTVEYKGVFDKYTVSVNVPYNGGSGCGDIDNALSGNINGNTDALESVSPTNFSCHPDGIRTLLTFQAAFCMGSSVDTQLTAIFGEQTYGEYKNACQIAQHTYSTVTQ